MLKAGHDFDAQVFKELDLVWKTYLHTPIKIKQKWVRRDRRPKRIHIYGWDDFFRALEKTVDSNPLMRIILDTIGKPELRYYPIYTRENSWYRLTNKKANRWIWTYYDRLNRVWDYEDNKVDFFLDKVYAWYPPILTWLFTNRPENKKHWDLLIYFIKKRYNASKKISTTETSNWGSEAESAWGTEEHSED